MQFQSSQRSPAPTGLPDLINWTNWINTKNSVSLTTYYCPRNLSVSPSNICYTSTKANGHLPWSSPLSSSPPGSPHLGAPPDSISSSSSGPPTGPLQVPLFHLLAPRRRTREVPSAAPKENPSPRMNIVTILKMIIPGNLSAFVNCSSTVNGRATQYTDCTSLPKEPPLSYWAASANATIFTCVLL